MALDMSNTEPFDVHHLSDQFWCCSYIHTPKIIIIKKENRYAKILTRIKLRIIKELLKLYIWKS